MAPPRICLATVGRQKAGPERRLFEHYLSRLRWRSVVREIEERRKLPAAERKRREGELLLAAHGGGRLVALDGSGRAMTSEALAGLIRNWSEDGDGRITFVIGGADGLDGAVLDAADLVLSLGPQTWPHMLVRVMLAEQLYRAQQILAGHPYHRE